MNAGVSSQRRRSIGRVMAEAVMRAGASGRSVGKRTRTGWMIVVVTVIDMRREMQRNPVESQGFELRRRRRNLVEHFRSGVLQRATRRS